LFCAIQMCSPKCLIFLCLNTRRSLSGRSLYKFEQPTQRLKLLQKRFTGRGGKGEVSIPLSPLLFLFKCKLVSNIKSEKVVPSRNLDTPPRFHGFRRANPSQNLTRVVFELGGFHFRFISAETNSTSDPKNSNELFSTSDGRE